MLRMPIFPNPTLPWKAQGIVFIFSTFDGNWCETCPPTKNIKGSCFKTRDNRQNMSLKRREIYREPQDHPRSLLKRHFYYLSRGRSCWVRESKERKESSRLLSEVAGHLGPGFLKKEAKETWLQKES